MFFLLANVAAFLWPQAASSFWYNDFEKISPYLPTTKEAFHEYLVEKIVPELSDNLYLNNNTHGDEGVTINKAHKTYQGYTLLSAIRGKQCTQFAPGDIYFTRQNKPTCNSILIDMDGNVVKEWPLIAFPVEMIPNGDVIGAVINRPDIVNGMPMVMEMDYCGTSPTLPPVWKWQGGSEPVLAKGGARFHHDVHRSTAAVYHAPCLDHKDLSGRLGPRTLVLANHDTLLPQYSFYGTEVPWSDFPLQDDALFEVRNSDGAVLWKWYPADHLGQLGFDDAAKSAIKTIRSMGIGGPPEDQFGPTDWAHLNTANYLGPNKWYAQGDLRFHPDNILIDSRTANWIAIIARHDHPDGVTWKSGDVVWRVGPHYSDGYKENGLGPIIGPHLAHMIPLGLPGAGNIMVFDNGGLAGYGLLFPGLAPEYGTYPATIRDYSRIVEFNPITLEKVWEYKNEKERTGARGTLERKFYSRLISNAQRLPNGNTLITEGQSGRVFEVTKKLEIVWEFINPYYDGAFLVGPATFLPENAVYRAYRVPYSWGKACP
jgi:hypothetical protein